MPKILAEMTIAEVLKLKPEAGEILMSHGMHCIGCAISPSESISQAAEVHGIDLKKLLEALNKE